MLNSFPLNEHRNKRRSLQRRATLIVVAALLLGSTLIFSLWQWQVQTVSKSRPLEPVDQQTITPAAQSLEIHKLKSDGLATWISKTLTEQNRLHSAKANVAVVNIWATWCEPCRQEMPELVKFHESKKAPLLLVSADNLSDLDSVKSFLFQSGVRFESSIIQGDQDVFLEGWQKIAGLSSSNAWSMTLPATFIVDPTGRAIRTIVGSTTQIELEKLIDSL